MCHLCTRDALVIRAIFTEAAKSMIQPPRTEHDSTLALACMLVTEAMREDERDGRTPTPPDVERMTIAARTVQHAGSDERTSALHFLSTLRRVVKSAEKSLGVAKHTLGDADAEERAPGLSAETGTPEPFNPFAGTRRTRREELN